MSAEEWFLVLLAVLGGLGCIAAFLFWPESECFQCGGEFPNCACVQGAASAGHHWTPEFLPDPHSAGGVIRTGDDICDRCGVIWPSDTPCDSQGGAK